MKAVVKFKDGKDGWEIRDVPRRDPKDHEIEIEIKAAGICGSELHLYHDNHAYKPPVIVGHEFSGVISRVGKDIQDWKVGDRVVSENHITACGICENCRTGNLALCKKRIAVGYSIDGGWTNFICMPPKLLIRIPDNITHEEAAMTEPCAILTEALCVKDDIKPWETVLVQGCGTIGLLAAQVAKATGVRQVFLTGTEADENLRLKIARQLEIDRVINIEREDLAEIVMNATDGRGADVVVEASGSPKAIDSSLELVKRLGRILAIGEAPGDMVELQWNKAIFKGCQIKFNFGSNYRAWHLALQYMSSGKINVGALMTHRISMKDFAEGFRLLDEKKAVKVMMYPMAD